MGKNYVFYRRIETMSSFSCIVLAAGNGNRFGSKKQFFEYKGKSLWEYVDDVCSQVSNDVVVVGVDVPGGSVRQESVYNGLQKIRYDRVVIAEAARPGVTADQIMELGFLDHPSVSYAVPSVDTIYYNGKHLIRSFCYRLQLPQAFDATLLKKAHEKFRGRSSTSDTQLIQDMFGIHPFLVEGGLNLFKITFRTDIKFLEALL